MYNNKMLESALDVLCKDTNQIELNDCLNLNKEYNCRPDHLKYYAGQIVLETLNNLNQRIEKLENNCTKEKSIKNPTLDIPWISTGDEL